jgi:DNA adenine methylase
MAKLIQPLKYFGGKHYLAPKIIALMPDHIHYVEPFAGGLSVLLHKDPRGISEVANDVDGDLTNFWTVMADVSLFPEFRRLAEATPFCEAIWDSASQQLHLNGLPESDPLRVVLSPVQRAWAYFVTCRQSMGARMEEFAPLSRNRVRRGMNEQASAWLTAVEGLPAVHERLKRVVILNRDFPEVFSSQDSPNTLFYCDPPYIIGRDEIRTTSDIYRNEMANPRHLELLEIIRACKGKVMISGYRSNMYDAALVDWNRREFNMPNQAAKGPVKRRMIECLWCNFELPEEVVA